MIKRDKEIRRWSWRLRDLMREAGRTQRSIERDAGWGKGYLTQVLAAEAAPWRSECGTRNCFEIRHL